MKDDDISPEALEAMLNLGETSDPVADSDEAFTRLFDIMRLLVNTTPISTLSLEEKRQFLSLLTRLQDSHTAVELYRRLHRLRHASGLNRRERSDER